MVRANRPPAPNQAKAPIRLTFAAPVNTEPTADQERWQDCEPRCSLSRPEPDGRACRHAPMIARRPGPPFRRGTLSILLLAFAALAVAACGSSVPGASTAPSPSLAPTVAPPTGPESAVDAVRTRVPLFDGITARDPDLIGQGTFWTADPTGDGWRVAFETGWGDCPAGCIDRHTWTWDVAADGSITFVAEDGSPLPEDILAAMKAGSTRTGVAGRATGGPTCPVERPGDPTCAPRLVGGAELAILDASGAGVAVVTTDGSGYVRLLLAPGEYTLEAPAVEGFMSGPAPAPFTVQDGAETWIDLSWDTGIR